MTNRSGSHNIAISDNGINIMTEPSQKITKNTKYDTAFLSVVVPCYNEECVLDELIRRLNVVCVDCVRDSYEIILINDGSTDNTWPRIKSLAISNPHITGINLSRNFGHQIALSAGLKFSHGEYVFIIDADLQDPPELLAEMMKGMNDGYDVIFGQRIKRQGETYFKKISASLFYRILARFTDIDIPVDSGDFRLMNRRAVDALNSMPEHYRFIRGMVSWLGFRQKSIQYDRSPRYAGTTKYSLSKMIKFAIDAITGFSIKPLRLASYAGIFTSAAATLYSIYVLISYFSGATIKGWASLIIIVLFLGSAQLLFTGLIGEYVGRLYMQSKNRPLFIIAEIFSEKYDNGSSAATHGEHTDG